MTVGRIPNIEGGIQPTLLTTTGDIMYASSASNPARLGIGSSAQVLTVASGVPSWATPASGSMTSIASGSLSGASVTLSSISGAYKELQLVVSGLSTSADCRFWLRINGAVGGSDYSFLNWITDTTFQSSQGESRIVLNPQDLSNATTTNQYVLTIPNYTNTTCQKLVTIYGSITTASFTGTQVFGAGNYRFTTAVTSLSMLLSTGTFDAGTYILYGVN